MLIIESDKLKLQKLVESINPNQFKGLTTKVKYLYPNIFLSIKKLQSDLHLKTFSEALYIVLNDLDDVPDCSHLSTKCCGKLKFKNIIEGYFPYCKACSSCNEDFKSKRTETILERYGTLHPNKNVYILEKIKNTVNQRYGVDNVKQIKKN